jgi:hypothetical protein
MWQRIRQLARRLVRIDRRARSSIIKQSRPVPQSTGSRSDPIVFGVIVSDVIQLRRQR